MHAIKMLMVVEQDKWIRKRESNVVGAATKSYASVINIMQKRKVGWNVY